MTALGLFFSKDARVGKKEFNCAVESIEKGSIKATWFDGGNGDDGGFLLMPTSTLAAVSCPLKI